jgi:GGDEF domain-containing protein
VATLNQTELDQLERRELQLTVVAAVFVFVLAAGLATFMYPTVFLHSDTSNKWTMRVAFFGFCTLTILFIGYLLDRQRTVRKLKQQILEELERNVELRLQASADLLQTMPDLNHFWDRLTMEYRRAMSMQKNLSLLLVKAKAGAAGGDQTAAWGDAAKAMSRKLRPTDSIYRLAPDLFGLVLPETDTLNACTIIPSTCRARMSWKILSSPCCRPRRSTLRAFPNRHQCPPRSSAAARFSVVSC